MKPSNTPPLPKPVVIPGIMELIRANKDRISLETFDMTYEEKMEYFRRGRIENPIFPADYELAEKTSPE
ncbi:MAG: hypothetical protein LBG47_00885 [Prevotellaceae bacterium]|jgi:hypothetical protein|nr:hypothetical protein [Prevotellaceae bacterium]